MNDLTAAQGGAVAASLSLPVALLRLASIMSNGTIHMAPQTFRGLMAGFGPRDVMEARAAFCEANPPATKAQISAALGRLSLHYWTPDNTPEQVRLRVQDFYADLAAVTASELDAACAAYRRDPNNRFFPTPGALMALAAPMVRERTKLLNGFNAALDRLAEDEGPKLKVSCPRDLADALAGFQRTMDTSPQELRRLEREQAETIRAKAVESLATRDQSALDELRQARTAQ